MGNKQTIFTDDQLDYYQDCTYFTRKDILRIFRRYRDLNPSSIPKDMTGRTAHTQHVSVQMLEKMPEFKENPFRRRVLEVFSKDGQGNLTFDEFLEMFSVFSESAPRDVKAHYAFRIYDFDGDSQISKADLSRAIHLLSRNEINDEETNFICDKIFDEADLDEYEKLSFAHFEYVISRAPDFMTTFHIRI